MSEYTRIDVFRCVVLVGGYVMSCYAMPLHPMHTQTVGMFFFFSGVLCSDRSPHLPRGFTFLLFYPVFFFFFSGSIVPGFSLPYPSPLSWETGYRLLGAGWEIGMRVTTSLVTVFWFAELRRTVVASHQGPWLSPACQYAGCIVPRVLTGLDFCLGIHLPLHKARTVPGRVVEEVI